LENQLPKRKNYKERSKILGWEELQSTVINTGKAFYFSERIFKFILFYVEHNPLAFFGAGV